MQTLVQITFGLGITVGLVFPGYILLGIAGSWLYLALWLGEWGFDVPLGVQVLVSALLNGLFVVVDAYRIGGIAGLLLIRLTPVAALVEHLSPWYPLAKRNVDFVVIDK